MSLETAKKIHHPTLSGQAPSTQITEEEGER